MSDVLQSPPSCPLPHKGGGDAAARSVSSSRVGAVGSSQPAPYARARQPLIGRMTMVASGSYLLMAPLTASTPSPTTPPIRMLPAVIGSTDDFNDANAVLVAFFLAMHGDVVRSLLERNGVRRGDGPVADRRRGQRADGADDVGRIDRHALRRAFGNGGATAKQKRYKNKRLPAHDATPSMAIHAQSLAQTAVRGKIVLLPNRHTAGPEYILAVAPLEKCPPSTRAPVTSETRAEICRIRGKSRLTPAQRIVGVDADRPPLPRPPGSTTHDRRRAAAPGRDHPRAPRRERPASPTPGSCSTPAPSAAPRSWARRQPRPSSPRSARTPAP